MVEQEPLAEQLPEAAQRPVGLRRVADVEHVEAAAGHGHPDRLHGRAHEAPEELGHEAERALGVHRQPVPVDVHVLEHLEGAGEALGLGADDAHPVAGPGQGGGLQPHPAVERDGQVLDDDQDPAGPTSRCHRSRPHRCAGRRPGRGRRSAARAGALGHRLERRVVVADHQGAGVVEHLVDAGHHQVGDVRDLVEDVALVGAHQLGQVDVGVVDADLVALADQPLHDLDHGALAQVVGAGLEGEPEHPDLARAGVGTSWNARSSCWALLGRIALSTGRSRSRPRPW